MKANRQLTRARTALNANSRDSFGMFFKDLTMEAPKPKPSRKTINLPSVLYNHDDKAQLDPKQKTNVSVFIY